MNLIEIAERIHPSISLLYSYYESQKIYDYELVGYIIIINLSIRKPKKWINRLLSSYIVDVSNSFNGLLFKDLPQIISDAIDINYINYKLKDQAVNILSYNIIDIFNMFMLYNIKHNHDNYINQSIVSWAINKRPYHLMTYIPKPMEVLRLQSHGKRVITVFTTLTDLMKNHVANLYYMKGNQIHSKDPLEFTLHDVKHMENFIHFDSYYEQIGLLRCLLYINNPCLDISNHCNNDLSILKPKLFFTNELQLDDQLWYELEYVISDMNCFCIHMLKYLLAKIILAIHRTYDCNSKDIESICKDYWSRILIAMRMKINDEVYFITLSLIDISFKYRNQLTPYEGDIIRNYFADIGRLNNN